MTDVVRNQKDSVFRMLYKEPKNALELYNGLNGTNYTDESLIKYNTLENAVYMNIKNDISFIIQDKTSMFEQQSTWTPNMPLRDLYYIADIFHSYEKNEQKYSLYGNRKIMLPNPEFVVFYNGSGKYPEYSEMKLSDSFIRSVGELSLELIVKVYNISSPMNRALKEKCPTLEQYVEYTELVSKLCEKLPRDEAVVEAVDECIKKGVLSDFLTRQKSEVIKMSIYEYDEEEERQRLLNSAMDYWKDEHLAEGREKGLAEGRAEASVQAVDVLIDKGCSLEESCELMHIPVETYYAVKEKLEKVRE